MCCKARATELEYFKGKEVWKLRKASEALKRQGKPPITVRWVEFNKGDDLNPKIRSGLVARARFGPRVRRQSLRLPPHWNR